MTDVLRARTEDTDPEVRGAALLGLAYRGEPNAVELLARELGGGTFSDDAVDAAAEIRDERLLPLLLDIKARGIESMYLDMAIRVCSGVAVEL